MKFLIVALACLAVGCAALKPELDVDWSQYKVAFNKKYNHAREELKRRSVWEENMNKIASHNRKYDLGYRTFSLGQNEYSDLSISEFRRMMNGFKMPAQRDMINVHKYDKNTKIADTVDWRDKNIVTDIKNQQQCGSCWAFSTTGSLEGQHALKTKKLVSLSEQQLVDCSGSYGNNGCEGGLMDNAFDYIKANKGIDTEDSYPYEAVDDTCRFKKDSIGATLTGHVDIPTGDEDALKNAVATVGPVSVAIDAGHDEFQQYSGGIFDLESCSTVLLDHGVLVVGYGTEDGKDYWLVKNSWGDTWGIDGYIKMSRNKNNQCGIATMASYPTV